MTANRHNSIFYGVDLWTVLLYVLIVMAGWVSITSASVSYTHLTLPTKLEV